MFCTLGLTTENVSYVVFLRFFYYHPIPIERVDRKEADRRGNQPSHISDQKKHVIIIVSVKLPFK